MTLTLNTSKRGVVTLPKELLEHIGVLPGEEIEITLLPDRQIGFKAARPEGSIEDFIGCLAGKTDVRLTIEEINEATAKAAADGVMDSFNRRGALLTAREEFGFAYQNFWPLIRIQKSTARKQAEVVNATRTGGVVAMLLRQDLIDRRRR